MNPGTLAGALILFGVWWMIVLALILTGTMQV